MHDLAASGVVAVMGTGGTIAGVSATGRDQDYQAAQLDVADLVAAVPVLSGHPIEARQVAQVDSKDMGWSVWRALVQAIDDTLARSDVVAVVITHGTDTLEETAWLLHLLLSPSKPVVLTAAMRPASSDEADGPRNLADAVTVARWAAERELAGVVAVLQGQVWSGTDVRKAHSWHIDAFDGGGALPLAQVLDGQVLPAPDAVWIPPRGQWLPAMGTLEQLPRVEIITSHADADGALVDALLAAWPASDPQRLRGLVVACTGHGTWHRGLEPALLRARRAGVVVWRSSRVARGGVESKPGDTWPVAGRLTPAQARVALAVTLALRDLG
jgi:L-asparaginase